MKRVKNVSIMSAMAVISAVMTGCATMDMAEAERISKECEQELSSVGVVVNGKHYHTLYEAEKAAQSSGTPADKRAVAQFEDKVMSCIESKAR